MTDASTVDAVVVGAGFGGLYQLHRLLGRTMKVRAFEAAEGVGGTWYWNRYPGARCDVQSIWYSYSFSSELEQEWVWTERYPAQAEVLRYLNHVADRFDLRRHITLGTKVVAATYDEARHRWMVSTDGGEVVDTRFLITAAGCLSNVPLPDIPGIGQFQGERYQTSRWPHEGVDFEGKRVGIIGTGSSGVQAIPELAKQAAHLTVFQRTPSFSLPAGNRGLTPDEVNEVKADYGRIRALMRQSGAGMPLEPSTRSAFDVTEAERTAIYEDSWNSGQPAKLGGSFNDFMTDRAANETAAEFVRSKIRQTVHQPDVAEMLCPTTYPIATKRLCIDTGYYETYNRENVQLVDLRRTPILEIGEHAVVTSDAIYEIDVLVLATGFDAVTGSLTAIDIRGRGGLALADKWSDGPKSYLGIAVAGFPNLFTITGPLSPSVLSNMVVSIEQHVDWISDCIEFLTARGLTEIEATAQAEEHWGEHVAEVGSYTLFPTADSWYMGANIPGKRRMFMCYVGGVGQYRQLCDEVARNGYENFHTAT